MTDPISQQKKSLRPHALAQRRVAHQAGAAEAAARLVAVLDALPGGAVAGYWPIGDELDLRPLLSALAGRGRVVGLPVVVEPRRPLDFRRWTPGTAMEPGAHGTWHPPATAAAVVPELLLVPLLGFDAAGWRLGYGGGYYDRTIAALRRAAHIVTIGVGYAAQQLDAVPHDDNDQRMDMILTEQGLKNGRQAGR